MNLADLVEFANKTAEMVFAQCGELYPMYFMVTDKGDVSLVPEPAGDKNESAALLREYMASEGITRYVSTKEAWTVYLTGTPAEVDKAVADINSVGGLHDHPDRIEVLMLAAEDHSEGWRSYHRNIIRQPGKRARLGPLVRDEYTQLEGRFVGMLPQPEGARLQ